MTTATEQDEVALAQDPRADGVPAGRVQVHLYLARLRRAPLGYRALVLAAGCAHGRRSCGGGVPHEGTCCEKLAGVKN